MSSRDLFRPVYGVAESHTKNGLRRLFWARSGLGSAIHDLPGDTCNHGWQRPRLAPAVRLDVEGLSCMECCPLPMELLD
jgi:hypothetical protein